MYRGNDILKIYDQDLNNIGRATREEVHTQGLLHQVAHVWMFQPKEDDTYIMIQKRSLDRELYPGKYDLIQTTHFDPDESYGQTGSAGSRPCGILLIYNRYSARLHTGMSMSLASLSV